MKIIGETVAGADRSKLLVEMTQGEYDAITGGWLASNAKEKLREAVALIDAAFPHIVGASVDFEAARAMMAGSTRT